MTNAAKLLRDFDLADPSERYAMIRGLVDRISLDEAKCLTKACHKQDILGHDRLPLEIRLMIVQHLDISDVYNCAYLVCHEWRNLFLGHGLMIEDVFQKWFPCLYDKDMPAEDMMDLYSRTMKRRNLRDMGRFQTRLVGLFGSLTPLSLLFPSTHSTSWERRWKVLGSATSRNTVWSRTDEKSRAQGHFVEGKQAS